MHDIITQVLFVKALGLLRLMLMSGFWNANLHWVYVCEEEMRHTDITEGRYSLLCRKIWAVSLCCIWKSVWPNCEICSYMKKKGEILLNECTAQDKIPLCPFGQCVFLYITLINDKKILSSSVFAMTWTHEPETLDQSFEIFVCC